MTRYVPPVKRIPWGDAHRYKDGNGQYIKGVTTWLGDGMPSKGLQFWTGRTVAECAVNEWDDLAEMPPTERYNYLLKSPDRALDNAAERGTKVHTLAEKLIAGEKVEVPEHVRGHVESMVRLLDEWGIDPFVIEALVYNLPHEWAGTCDVLGHCRKKPGLGFIDWKTSNKLHGKHGLQLTGYAHGTHYVDPTTIVKGVGQPTPMPPIEWAYLGHIRADGYEMRPVDISDENYRNFRYVQMVAKFEYEGSKSIIGPAEDPPVEETA